MSDPRLLVDVTQAGLGSARLVGGHVARSSDPSFIPDYLSCYVFLFICFTVVFVNRPNTTATGHMKLDYFMPLEYAPASFLSSVTDAASPNNYLHLLSLIRYE